MNRGKNFWCFFIIFSIWGSFLCDDFFIFLNHSVEYNYNLRTSLYFPLHFLYNLREVMSLLCTSASTLALLIIYMTLASHAIFFSSNFFLQKMRYWSTCFDYLICHENKCHTVGDDTVNYAVESKCYSFCDCYYCPLPYRSVIIWLAVRIFKIDEIWYSFILCSKPSDNSLHILFLFFEIILLDLTLNWKTLTFPNNLLFIYSCIHSKVFIESIFNTKCCARLWELLQWAKRQDFVLLKLRSMVGK